MTQEQFSAAFKNSPMKRAKLRGLRRNAAVVLGNVIDRGRHHFHGSPAPGRRNIIAASVTTFLATSSRQM